MLAAGQPIVTLAQPSELEAVFDVAEKQVSLVKPGLSVQVALLSARDKPFAGRVREVSPSADPTTRTYRVRTAIPYPPPGLELGMTAVVMLETNAEQLRPRDTGHRTAREGSQARGVGGDEGRHGAAAPVTVARYESDEVWLTSGLQAGDRIVTAGVHKLMPGQKVRAPEADAMKGFNVSAWALEHKPFVGFLMVICAVRGHHAPTRTWAATRIRRSPSR